MPYELHKKTALYAEEDAERLVSEIAEINLLLFAANFYPDHSHCRPRLAPTALMSSSPTRSCQSRNCVSSASKLSSRAFRLCGMRALILLETPTSQTRSK